jgi:hypothetical protein
VGHPVSRRRFLGLSITAGAVAAALSGCTVLTNRAAPTGPAAPLVATSSGGPAKAAVRTARTVGPAVSEASFDGTNDWHLGRIGAPEAVAGYTDKTDVVPGEPFTMYISSTAQVVDIDALRMGAYRLGHARRVWSKRGVRVHQQAKATLNSRTFMNTADWDATLTVPTDGWPEGAYLLRLSCADGRRYVPMIVRSEDATGRLLLVHATSTWAAYNLWGERNLYQGPGGPDDYVNRSRVVSFNRPYNKRGAEKFLAFERPVVELAERLRLPLAYTTSAHVHDNPKLLLGASAIISLGHDEYWTPQMRSNVTTARDAGVNLAFLGANACFRRIRFDQGDDGGANRHVVCYKSDWRKDPMHGVNDALVTNDYRQHPRPHPECTLTGTYYEAYPAEGAYRVLTPNSWLFAGSGAKKGSTYPGLIGPEYDRVNPVVKLPRPMQVLSHSPIRCKHINTYSDSAYYTTDSGAGVFNAGTMNWTRALSPLSTRGFPSKTTALVQQVTTNLFHAFQDGPAAARFPAVDNLDQVKPYVGDPTWDRHNLW